MAQVLSVLSVPSYDVLRKTGRVGDRGKKREERQEQWPPAWRRNPQLLPVMR